MRRIACMILMVAFAATGLIASPCFQIYAKELSVASDKKVTGFQFPESVAYDPHAKVLYISQFGSELKPTLKDGKGKISKVLLAGEIEEEVFLPAHGQVLNKPKGIWVSGDRLWVTDIDSVWVFDLKSRRGKMLPLPDSTFANDPAVTKGVLYVSDTGSDCIYRIEPADFLNTKKDPKISVVYKGGGCDPNGLYPASDGSILFVGYNMNGKPGGIYKLEPDGKVTVLAKDIGMLDGLFQMNDGSLLITDWSSGSLVHWTAEKGIVTLAQGFQGPADFAVIPEKNSIMVVVPDLVTGDIRFIVLTD